MYSHLEISNPASGILQVALNRPKQFNALSEVTFRELDQVLTDFEKSDNNVLILTGVGRAFCFGADFQEFQDSNKLPDLLRQFQSLILKLYYCHKPTIAALNGFATGAGLDLALACDLRIASERAKMGEAYIAMGLVSDGGGSFFLPRLIGISRALQMLMTGESIDASQALSFGIVHSVTPPDQLASASVELARMLCSKPQNALRLLKKLVKQNALAGLETALKNEQDAQLNCFEDPAHLELVKDYLARRSKKQES
jgi:enoyl-CoA hydratase/carnithine racemase